MVRGARSEPRLEARAQHPGARVLTAPARSPGPSRRLIGIDLGTTNSALAWVDLEARGARKVQLFAIPQLVAAAEVAPWPVLPSFLYFPTEAERASGRFALPWDPAPESVTGVLARDHGALVPARQVASAKSWLSNPMVDRTAALLPWIADGSAPKISPVTAAARYLTHLREAWNHTYARADESLRFEHQAIVLTVPASFDEEARELTVEAARTAGCKQLTLLEEPLAALYAFLATHSTGTLAAGQLVLVCDVGGGTTDFSLIRASQVEDELRFERVAIGEHLLLGGDNADLALAALVEQRLAQANGNTVRLSLAQQQTLRRQCSAAKEKLLGDNPPEEVTITILGSGRGLIGGALHAVLKRAEVVTAIESFLPLCARDELPRRDRRLGLRELGLPYESEPAVTRHLAAFLRRSAQAHDPQRSVRPEPGDMAQPTAVLFNGGFFAPAIARDHILAALTAWFGTPPLVLANERPEAAVAVGAAFYARLLHDPTAARRLLIRAGSARAYYIGVEATALQSAGQKGITAVCIMPRGTEEGTDLTLAREFTVVTNQPVAFTLYSSTQRTDALDDVVVFDSLAEVHRHAPLATTLRFGKRAGCVPIGVRLAVRYTELGTLELVCEAQATTHRWQLQFNLRAMEQSVSQGVVPAETTPSAATPPAINFSAATIAAACAQVRQVFDTSLATRAAPDTLVKDLEATLGASKGRWPLPVIRQLADALLTCVAGRALSARHEARWLNLMGFCARPGFGTSSDAWRITELRKVYAAELAFPKDVQCQVEWLVLWQRVAAGFSAPQQRDLVQRLGGQLGLNARKPAHLNAQIVRESWRLLGSLERLEAGMRVRLGDEVLTRALREPQNNAYLWALGRFGARVPIYGPLNAVVSAAMAERWLEALLGLESLSGEAVATIVQIGARTDDPARDVSEAIRQRAIERLTANAVSSERLRALQEVVQIDSRDLVRAFGESLPEGLRLVS